MSSRKMLYSGTMILALVVFAAGCSATTPQGASAAGGPGGTGGGQTLAYQAGQPDSSAPRGITVVGAGTASGTPDVAHVDIGIDTQAGSVQQAVSDNKTKMNALLAALKSAGIADQDIRTTNYSVYTERPPVPTPSGNANSQTVTYHVANQVSVTVRDVNQLGGVLDKAVAAGANNIYGVNFGVKDPSQLQSDARARAVADAKARAESLAKSAGVTLGDVVSINELSGAPGPIFAPAAVGSGGGGAPIQPGELDVTVSVQVTYAIK